MRNEPRTILVCGLRSCGKSSLVGALWKRADLLPTAERDCTQTNTVLRAPAPDEAAPALQVKYLTRERALAFAVGSLPFYRIVSFLKEHAAIDPAQIDDGLPGLRLRHALDSLRELFGTHPRLEILNDHLSGDRAQLEELIATLDASDFPSGQIVSAPWDDRRDHVMGRRGPDGRNLDAGRLQAYDSVELVCATDGWSAPLPVLIDSPWVPAYHEARRSDLIAAQAARADAFLIAARPELLAPEPWLEAFLKKNPARARQTHIVFNMIDTLDPGTLFQRDGFAGAFEASQAVFKTLGVPAEHFTLACARWPFLNLLTEGFELEQRRERLRKRLERLRDAASSRASHALSGLLRRATDPSDAGVESLRTILTGADTSPSSRLHNLFQ